VKNIIPRISFPGMMISVVVIYEIRVACYDAKSLGSVGAFNGVGFIIIPIYILEAEVDVMSIIV
jgi:hypothetical protein